MVSNDVIGNNSAIQFSTYPSPRTATTRYPRVRKTTRKASSTAVFAQSGKPEPLAPPWLSSIADTGEFRCMWTGVIMLEHYAFADV
ncbi:hypothetical protein KPH14_010824 [Odynerus spinipes]|uniref:Uncharacterized protein n=1 Tax=Odynerus spinipes TaxID=1348599 RepID=A0AAD9RGZ3_9HYME|nr:hypothetical protein KPH14_010824 [Odynerus spinipes]